MEEKDDDNKKGKNEIEFKVITLGNQGAGKTSIINSYVNDKFDPDQISTLGACFSFKTIKINNTNIKLNFIDTSGQEKFRSLSISYFRHVDVVLFVFDLNEPKSFESVQYWIDLFNENNNGKKIKAKYLVGNKNDLEQKIDQNLIEEITKKNNILYISTSAKTKNQIEVLFQYIGGALYDYLQIQRTNTINQNDTTRKKIKVLSKTKVKKKNKKCCG